MINTEQEISKSKELLQNEPIEMNDSSNPITTIKENPCSIQLGHFSTQENQFILEAQLIQTLYKLNKFYPIFSYFSNNILILFYFYIIIILL